MGLREKKAARTRRRIVAEAVRLFKVHGYVETTMESIADAAEIHPSTLYRYFPSKDLIVFEDFATGPRRFAEVLAAKIDELPLPAALMATIDVVFDHADSERRMDQRLLRTIIDQSPVARARVWDLLAEQREKIGEIVAGSLGRQPADYEVILAARIAILIAETAADVWRTSGDEIDPATIARDLVRTLRDGDVVLPDPAPTGSASA